MNYKDVCENQLKTLKSIINVLADVRDSINNYPCQEKYFQCQIDSIASIKNCFEKEYMDAQIEEAKERL